VHDPAVAKCIALPDAMRKYNVEDVLLADYAKHPLLREGSPRFRHHRRNKTHSLDVILLGRK
jgi:hypothetical protein